MAMDNRKTARVAFISGYRATMMASDGTWRRNCVVANVSDSGARLTVAGSTDGLNLEEFFLLLSPNGNANRRCGKVWLQGDEVGVRFLKPAPKSRRAPR